jgi:hypothetical protein
MKYFAVLLALIPTAAFAAISGMDDYAVNIPAKTQADLDNALEFYYQHPTREKVDTILGIMNGSDLMHKKSAWPPMVGFLTVVFSNNQRYLFHWMGLEDYNSYSQDIFITALLHAKLKETALVFAQAHQWKGPDLTRIKGVDDTIDLKHLTITAPGHIDTLWGAFFATGDPVYVNEIIDVLFVAPPSAKRIAMLKAQGDSSVSETAAENKRLAQATLRTYAPYHPVVLQALEDRMEATNDETNRSMLLRLLPRTTQAEFQGGMIPHKYKKLLWLLLIPVAALLAAMIRKRKYQ